jgi:hypothetical protein
VSAAEQAPETSEEVRARARALDGEIESARALLLSFRAEQSRLLRLADEMDARPAEPEPAVRGSVKETARFDRRVLKTVRESGGLNAPDLAARLHVKVTRARGALYRLVEAGEIVRVGINKGQVFKCADQVGDDVPMPWGATWREYVRDMAVELDTFSRAEAHAAMPDISTATVDRYLCELEADGVLTSERVGGAKVYAYVPPPDDAPNVRPRGEPQIVARRITGGTVDGVSRHGGVRGERRRFVRAAEEAGATTREGKHGTIIELDGKVVTGVPKTPSDHRSLKNTKADLKRAGIEV